MTQLSFDDMIAQRDIMTSTAPPLPPGHPLSVTLEVAVPLHIMELECAGGPTVADFTNLAGFADELGAKGDQLLFGGKDAAMLFNRLARAIAVISYCPGGITLFGQHWETPPG